MALPLLVSHSSAARLSGIIGFAIVGLSVGVIAGLGGQLSLGQFALAAVGATVSYHVSSRTGWFALSFVYAGIAGALVSLLIGLPALRLRGLMLTVTTLSFALLTPSWLLTQPWMLGDGRDPGRPVIGSNPLNTDKEYYYFALAILVVAVVLARNVRVGGFGRLLVAVRDNEDNARAFTVRARTVKLQGFLVAGFLAGIGGAAYGHAFSRISQPTFPVSASISVVAMSVIGGISILGGPIIGAVFVIGFPAFVPLDSAGLAATQLGQLLIILYLPGGLAQVLQPGRDRIVRTLARRAGVDPRDGPSEAPAAAPSARAPAVPSRNSPAPTEPTIGEVVLEADGLRRSFGGVRAVDGVSLTVRRGETLGLIGPNGAGKTTLFELLSGFTKPDDGRVLFAGADVSRLGPEARASLGLIRSFQDAALFPTMTVDEVVALSLERVSPTGFLRSAAGLHGADRAKTARARELVDRMGLAQYRSKLIQELSTGTRRIAELACLIALEPTVLLLDEPSSGIAQRETEALAELLRDLREELDLTLVIIEHDIPMIMSLSDRIVVMETGTVLAEGPPAVVRADPRVVEAYLGGAAAAIERSGTTAPAAR
jgi:ABC-type branched-subunit amino acid transport system ATPase component/ABC-type branched-subunit amino acid transport system permease subunit